MVICLMYFYQGQDEVFESKAAVVNGARNITGWLIKNDFRNVIIDVANEWNLSSRQRWDHGNFIPENVAGIVFDIREQFVDSAFTLPIGASTDGRMLYPASMARLCDLSDGARQRTRPRREAFAAGSDPQIRPGAGGLDERGRQRERTDRS